MLHLSLEDILIQQIGEVPASHHRQPSSSPGGRITIEQYFDVEWLCWSKIYVVGGSLVARKSTAVMCSYEKMAT